ncbi:MAG: hypothetical protein PGN13_13275 [Patulibacter minatonensis]
MAEELYSLVRDAAAPRGLGRRLVDLYCGIGTIGLTLAHRARAELWGIESIPQAIQDAMEVAQREGYKDPRELRRRRRAPSRCPLCSSVASSPMSPWSNPPRAGLSQKVVRRIVRRPPPSASCT